MRFQFQVILRSLLISATSIAMAATWTLPGRNFTVLLIVAALVLQIWLLVRFLNRTNRELARFLDAIVYDDFSQSFSFKQSDTGFKMLGDAFNRVIKQFREVRQQKEQSAQFLQVVLEHIPIAVLVVTPEDKVTMINAAAKRLLGILHLRQLEDLAEVDPVLPKTLRQPQANGRKVVRVNLDRQHTGTGISQQLAVSWTDFKSGSDQQRIIGMQNIRAELENREIRAWQDLIRVLSHEIMNSLTPIASLSRSSSRLIQPMVQDPSTADAETLADVDDAVETIARRAEGLLGFVDSYRDLARLPAPQPEYVSLARLFGDTLNLMQTEAIPIQTDITPQDLSLFVDPTLISQALINLLKNALEAVSDQSEPQVKLKAWQDAQGNSRIEVSDNGCGIKATELDNIWVPFYTTKSSGTGVGLSLTRQIIVSHGGSIQAYSSEGQGTRIVIVLNR